MVESILAQISRAKSFPNMRFVQEHAINVNFHYRTKSVKINDHIFQYIQIKIVFGLFLVRFPYFGGKNFYWKDPALSCTTSYGFLAPCQNLQKN